MYRIKTLPFLLWWVACAIFVWPLATIAVGIAMIPILLLANMLIPNDFFYSGSYEFIMPLVIIPLIGISVGFTVAGLQRWLLRSKLYWTADNWRKMSIIGGIIGALATGAVVWFMGETLPYRLQSDWQWFLAMPVFVGFVSAFQWLTLRHAVKDA
jgi:hypothetical protein